MKSPLVLAAVFIPLAGCGLNDFAQKQADWNHRIGMDSMNPGGAMAGPSASERATAEQEAQTQRNIKQGEDLENEEARKAGLGPSPTEGMNCTTTTNASGSANNGTSTSSTTCHN
jgi:hypothetical protein